MTGVPLYNPKGLALHDGKLYYADKDYDAVVNVDLTTGASNFTKNNLNSVSQLKAYTDRHNEGKLITPFIVVDE